MADIGLSSILLRLAARDCGVNSVDPALAEFTTHQVNNQAKKLVQSGQLHMAKLSHRNVRYYVRKAHALACMRNAALTVKAGAFGNAARRPVQREGWVEATEQNPNGVQITYCPPWKPRFQSFDLPVNTYGGNQRGRVLREETPS